MRDESYWHSSSSGIAVAALLLAIVLAVILLGRAPEQSQPDTRHLHQRPGHTELFLNPADAALQSRGIAASRHVTVQEVRQLMDERTEGKGQETLGHQRISIDEFNRTLDERWPIK